MKKLRSMPKIRTLVEWVVKRDIGEKEIIFNERKGSDSACQSK